MTISLTTLANPAIEPTYDHPRAERRVRGNPLRTTWTHHDQHGLSAGVWACEPGAWRIAFAPDTHEFFHVLEGRIRITSDAGEAREFGPGDACVIPAGFTGLFEVLEPVRKHFVFVERQAAAA